MTHTYDDKEIIKLLDIVDSIVLCPTVDARTKLAVQIYKILDNKKQE